MTNRRPRILCLDFDGTLNSYTSGWCGVSSIPDLPVPGAMRFIEAAQAAGFVVAIHSSRSGSLRGRRAMKRWLECHLIDHFGVDRVAADDCFSAIRWPRFKPRAFLTIDDRALTFQGTWPDPRDLHGFKPWNKETTHAMR